AQLAEDAMLRAIDAMDLNAHPSEELLHQTIMASTRITAARKRHRYGGDDVAILPVELRNVAQLPAPLRHSFILRMLLALSRCSTACLLDSRVSTVERNTRLAAQMLARWSTAKAHG